MEDEAVFRALADPTRRRLLDLLFERDGRTLTELESQLPIQILSLRQRNRGDEINLGIRTLCK